MNRAFLFVALGVLLILTPVLRAGPALPECPDDRDTVLWTFMDDYLLALYARDPMSYEQTLSDESRLSEMMDVSSAAQAEWTEALRSFRDRLGSLDRSGYGPLDHTDHDLMALVIDQAIESAGFKRHQTPITSISGPQVWLPQMGTRVAMRTQAHREAYLDRLKRIDIVIGDHMDNMREGIAAGRVMPRVVIEPVVAQALAQCTPEIRRDAARSPFYAPFRALDADDPVATEAREIISARIVPVFQELAVFLQNTYIPACRASVAASDGIDGSDGYAFDLRIHTTLDSLTPDSVHQTGLDEVNRIKSEMMDTISRTDWYEKQGNAISDDNERFAAFVTYLREDPRFYHDTPEALVDGYRAMSKLVDPELVSLFGRLPRLPYGVRRLPRFQEPSAPTAYYYPGSIDAGVPGYFMANASKLDQRPRYEMLALTIHEAVPGHHLQIALAQEIENQHTIRRTMSFTAFVEGWALYAERLGLEMGAPPFGVYEDPYDDFGRLNMEMWRALRLVVDTGIHAKNWSRQDAIDYMIENSALAPHNIVSEVDRYIGWPGQATAYKIGQLKIIEIRERAERELGDAFDIRAFHDELLGDGAVPLPVLEEKMDRWIQTQR